MKIKYLLIIAAALTACAKSDPQVIKDVDVNFRIANGQTRTTFMTDLDGKLSIAWEDADMVGISACEGEDVVGVNYSYRITAGSDVLEPESSVYSFKKTATQRTYYAYYPFTGEVGDGVHYVTPVSLPTEQQYNMDEPLKYLSDYWVMRTEPFVVASDSASVDLAFYGVYSVIELKLLYSSPATRNYPLNRLMLGSLDNPLSSPQGNMNLTSGQDEQCLISNTPVNNVALNLEHDVILSDTETKTFYLIVLPGKHNKITLDLSTSNGMVAKVDIDGAVTFAPNTVYHKTIVVNPEIFESADGSDSESTLPLGSFALMTEMSDLTDGQYLIAFRYDDASSYLVPTTPVKRNPAMVSFLDAGIVEDSMGNVISIEDGYEWTLSSMNGGCKFSYELAGQTYYLIASNKAQGIAVSSDLTGHYSTADPPVSYTDIWKISLTENGKIAMQGEGISRYLSPYPKDVNTGNDLYRWQMSTAIEQNGNIRFYKKVTE